MKKLALAALGTVVLAAASWSAATPAQALGMCGPNGHRNAYGRCVFGGQNQAWCLRHTGRRAAYGPGGTRWCR